MNLAAILQCPIPDMSDRRAIKGYRDYPLNREGSRNREPLVDIAQYGIAGQSYYSRHNAATDKPLKEVGEAVFLRQSVAEKLAAINYELQQSDAVAELVGGRVELYIDEGLRSRDLQRVLYETVFPRLIRQRNPGLSKSDILALRDSVIAKPSDDASPAPHATGAAVDLKFRYVQAEQGFIAKRFVDMGHARGDLGSTTWPDYFEHLHKLDREQKAAQRHRRVFYWVMRGALNSEEFGFEVNPNEWWHWSFGDQLWAQMRSAPCAFYNEPEQ
jgi:D-alanyl-D-alanine dipeptidase